MTIEKLSQAISTIETAIINLESVTENVDSEIASLERIRNNLSAKLQNMTNSFNRKEELKVLLNTVLKFEGMGYETALECYVDCDMNRVFDNQFNRGVYTLSNGERISKDFRVILYYYLNA